MRHKKSLIIFSVVFVALTIFVYCASNTTTTKRVKFKNQSIAISQGSTQIINERLGVNISNTDSSLQNQDLNANHQDLNIGDNGMGISNANTNINNQRFENQNTNINNQGDIRNSNVGFHNSDNINYQETGYHNSNRNFSGDNRTINNQNNRIKNNFEDFRNAGDLGNDTLVMNNQNYERSNVGKYQNIDWSTWKSNFVNRFLDDSLYIQSLDLYGIGTWFYYSFNVSDKGAISDIKVFSFYLSKEDKDKITDLIKSYEYQPITVFPANTKRDKAKVKAIVLLGDTESKARPSDFNDLERIKIKY